MKISLVIPAHNEEKLLGKCLTAALAQELPFYEIIVVDNASTDRTLNTALAYYPRSFVVYESRKGLPYARQKGFEAATGDIVAYCDADTELPPDWSKRICYAFQAPWRFNVDPNIVCVSNPTTYPELPWWKRQFVKFVWWGIVVRLTYAMTGRMINGACFAIRRETLEKMRGFDTNIEFYGEDGDIVKRAHKLGRVKFLFDLEVPASARRFKGQGFFNTALVYACNFWRPLTKSHQDYR
jgi:glycosyltransferase involved in cell wall biosynthesis